MNWRILTVLFLILYAALGIMIYVQRGFDPLIHISMIILAIISADTTWERSKKR